MTIYVSPQGSNLNPGTYNEPLKTIQHAANIARPGTTIKILSGIYRESVKVFSGSLPFLPITFTGASNDRGKVIIAGSENSPSMKWSKCDKESCPDISKNIMDKVYFTKLDWQEIPYLIYEETGDGVTHELHIARAPNFQVTTDWKYHEHWWTAENSSENKNILKDRKLKTLGDLTGATIYLIDGESRCGQFLYSKNIDHFDKNHGEITFDKPVGFSIFGSQENGISKYTKYYVEGKLHLLDTVGEWLFDTEEKILYIWPLENGNPANLPIEIAKRSTGFIIQNASNIKIDGLSFRYINENRARAFETTGAIVIDPKPKTTIKNIAVLNTDIKYSSNGISVYAPNHSSVVENIQVSKNDIGFLERSGFTAIASTSPPSNISGITIANSNFHHSSFTYNNIGLDFKRINKVKLLKNHIYDNANYGIHFTSFEKDKEPIQDIEIKDNVVENNCLSLSSCSSIKMYGGEYKNTVLRNNILRNNLGWSYCQEKKYGSDGYGVGLFISNASGINAIENFSNNHTSAAFFVYPRQLNAKNNSFIKNFAGQSSIGLELSNPEGVFDYDPVSFNSRHDNTIVRNNIFWENNIGIELDPAKPEKLYIKDNIYIDNKLDIKYRNIEMKTATEIQKQIPFWDSRSFDTDSYFLKKLTTSGFRFFQIYLPAVTKSSK